MATTEEPGHEPLEASAEGGPHDEVTKDVPAQSIGKRDVIQQPELTNQPSTVLLMDDPEGTQAQRHELIENLTKDLLQARQELAMANKEVQYWKRKAFWATNTEPQILSGAISSTDNWYERTWLLLHEPIRMALVDVEELVIKAPAGFDPTKYPWKVTNFFYFFNSTFAPYVRRHNDVLEKVYFPWIAQKAAVPDHFKSNHAAIDKLIKDVESSEVEYRTLVRAAKTSPAPDSLYEWRSTLITRLIVTTDAIRDHLNEEERFFPPIVHHHFTQKQENTIVEKMASVTQAHIELPLILKAINVWGNPQIRDEFLGRLSVPSKHTLSNYWVTAFDKQNYGALESLALDHPPPTSYVPLISAPALIAASPLLLMCCTM